MRTDRLFCLWLFAIRGCVVSAPQPAPAAVATDAGATSDLPQDQGRVREVQEPGQERPEHEHGGLLWTRNP